MTSVAIEDEIVDDAWRSASLTRVRVALAGCGAVGSVFLRELASHRDALASRHGIEVDVVSVLVRDLLRPRDVSLDRSLLTNDVDAFLANDVDVVIEAIGGFDPALRIATATLSRGRKLITANKLLLANHGTRLASLARENRTTLRYDAAVGGGVPILRMLDQALGAGGPTRVCAILNGTANFVLSRLEQNIPLDAALAEAQAAGFAEADSSRDLDGRDAADKTSLVAWTAFGIAPEVLRVRRVSLLPDPQRYSMLAERYDSRVRQVAECSLYNGAVLASVEPQLVSVDSAMGRTIDEGNHVDVFVGWRAPLSASGPGAGGLPTATALLSDLLAANASPRRRESRVPTTVDARRFRWAIDVLGEPGLLHRAVPACGVVKTDFHARSSWTTIESATVAEIASILAMLEGSSPIVARFSEPTCQ